MKKQNTFPVYIMTLLQMFQNHKIVGFFPDSTEKQNQKKLYIVCINEYSRLFTT